MSFLANPLRRLGASPRAATPIHRQLLTATLVLVVATGAIGLMVALWIGSGTHFSDFSVARNNGYSQTLREMGEPVLRAGSDSRSYRFLWVPAFHDPVAVRIESAHGRGRLVAVELQRDAQGRRTVRRRQERALSAQEFARVEHLATDGGFWTMPANAPSEGNDGAQWIVEAATDRYHAVDRWSPGAGPAHDIGLQMMALTGWVVGPDGPY